MVHKVVEINSNAESALSTMQILWDGPGSAGKAYNTERKKNY